MEQKKIVSYMPFKETIDGQRELDKHVEEHHDTVAQVTETGPVLPGSPEFCAVYKAARPILLLVKGMLFFKPKWQTVLTGLIAGLDAVCPD